MDYKKKYLKYKKKYLELSDGLNGGAKEKFSIKHCVKDIETMLQRYIELDYPIEMFLNMLLVKANGRRATLIELANLECYNTQEKDKIISELDTFMRLLGLVQVPADTPFRYMILRPEEKVPLFDNHEIIGEYLGFKCVDHDWCNRYISRLALHITETTTGAEVYTEVCESERITIDKLQQYGDELVKKFNESMKSLGLSYNYEGSVCFMGLTQEELLNNYTDKEFVSENIEDYSELIYNDFVAESVLVNEKLILSEYSTFVKIMEHIVKGDLDALYDKYPYGTENFNILTAELVNYEKRLIACESLAKENIKGEVLLSMEELEMV